MENKNEIIEYLANLKFEQNEIDNMMLLLNDDENIDVNKLHEKIKYLININFGAREIRIILSGNPGFYLEDINLINHNIEAIKQNKWQDMLTEIIVKSSELITLPKGHINEAVGILEKLNLNKDELKELIETFPEILVYKKENIQKTVEFIIENNLTKELIDILIDNPDFFENQEMG